MSRQYGFDISITLTAADFPTRYFATMSSRRGAFESAVSIIYRSSSAPGREPLLCLGLHAECVTRARYFLPPEMPQHTHEYFLSRVHIK